LDCAFLTQSLCIPPGYAQNQDKFRVIIDSLTQTTPDEAVLNHITNTDLKAGIYVGQAKMNLFILSIYNWQVSFPNKIISLILADIFACFQFPQILADVTGAFSFLEDCLYFLLSGHVFGSNTSASSWEALKRAIHHIIPVYTQ
jgi:hypothetical protein